MADQDAAEMHGTRRALRLWTGGITNKLRLAVNKAGSQSPNKKPRTSSGSAKSVVGFRLKKSFSLKQLRNWDGTATWRMWPATK